MSLINRFAEAPSLLDDCDLQVIERPVPTIVDWHRQRLRDRFTTCGETSVADYELLELLLFRPIPRLDVKPPAFALLKAFGELNQVLAASPARLAQMVILPKNGCVEN